MPEASDVVTPTNARNRPVDGGRDRGLTVRKNGQRSLVAFGHTAARPDRGCVQCPLVDVYVTDMNAAAGRASPLNTA